MAEWKEFSDVEINFLDRGDVRVKGKKNRNAISR